MASKLECARWRGSCAFIRCAVASAATSRSGRAVDRWSESLHGSTAAADGLMRSAAAELRPLRRYVDAGARPAGPTVASPDRSRRVGRLPRRVLHGRRLLRAERPRPRAVIKLRGDDRGILELFAERFGIGTVRDHRPYGNPNPSAVAHLRRRRDGRGGPPVRGRGAAGPQAPRVRGVARQRRRDACGRGWRGAGGSCAARTGRPPARGPAHVPPAAGVVLATAEPGRRARPTSTSCARSPARFPTAGSRAPRTRTRARAIPSGRRGTRSRWPSGAGSRRSRAAGLGARASSWRRDRA